MKYNYKFKKLIVNGRMEYRKEIIAEGDNDGISSLIYKEEYYLSPEGKSELIIERFEQNENRF